MYAAASVFRNFQKTQKLVSGGWCLGSKETDQPVAGRAACMIKLDSLTGVFRRAGVIRRDTKHSFWRMLYGQ